MYYPVSRHRILFFLAFLLVASGYAIAEPPDRLTRDCLTHVSRVPGAEEPQPLSVMCQIREGADPITTTRTPLEAAADEVPAAAIRFFFCLATPGPPTP